MAVVVVVAVVIDKVLRYLFLVFLKIVCYNIAHEAKLMGVVLWIM